MAKIVANDVRVVMISSDDVATIRRRCPDLSSEAIDACATVAAAMRYAHCKCGPGTEAVRATFSIVPSKMRKKAAKEMLQAA